MALVDPGPSSCLETLRASLADAGHRIGDIRKLLLTHIHLDHAGASGSLLRENPDIEVYVHERGAPHMIDPSKLLASAARLYGDEMDELWGPSCPCPPTACTCSAAGSASRPRIGELEVAYTPGHAAHHVSFFDQASGIAFVGDVAGVRIGREPFVLPPARPRYRRRDLERQHRAGAAVASLDAPRTHFGVHEDPDEHLDAMRTHLAGAAEIARSVIEAGGSEAEQANGSPGRCARTWSATSRPQRPTGTERRRRSSSAGSASPAIGEAGVTAPATA